MKVFVLLLALLACRADEFNYHSSLAQDADAAAEPRGEAVSVAFENLPLMQDNNTSINIGVVSKNGASTYQYALLVGEVARAGSSACENADYSDFIPLTQTISRHDLAEGAYLICALGKDVAGTRQKMPSVFAWLIDAEVIIDEDEGEQPDEDELAKEVTAVPTGSDPAPPPPIEETPYPLPTPSSTPEPSVSGTPAPSMPMQAEIKISESSEPAVKKVWLGFSNGETRKRSIYVHNEGTAPLNWRMQSDSNKVVKWLQAEYDGTRVEQIPDDSENAIFSGTVPAGSKSAVIDFSLKLNAGTRKVADEYLEYRDPTLYRTRLVFYDDDNNTSVALHVGLYIPKLLLGNANPRIVNGKEQNWQLSLSKDKMEAVRIYANNRGRGYLSWQVKKIAGSGINRKVSTVGSNWDKVSDSASWFLVRKRRNYIEIKLHASAQNKKLSEISDGWVGSYYYVTFVSNGGRSYRTQSAAGRRWLKVCFEEKENEHKNKCGNIDYVAP